MGRETELLIEETNKRLDKLLTAINNNSGGSGLALEATQVDNKNLLTSILSDTNDVNTGLGTSNTTLANILTALLGLKDGEFRMYQDPNDNDRYVAITVDLTDPPNPQYTYKYVDTNTPYTGNVNDLELIPNSVYSSIEQLLIDIRNVFNNGVRHYVIWNGTPGGFEATTEFVFNYYTDTGGYLTYTDNEDLMNQGTFPDATSFVNAMNALSGIPFQFEIVPNQIVKDEGINTFALFINSGTQSIPNQFDPSTLQLDIDNNEAERQIFTYIPTTNTQGLILKKLLEVRQDLALINADLDRIDNKLLYKRRGYYTDINTSSTDPYPSYPWRITGFTVSFLNSDNEVKTLPDITITNFDDLIETLDEHSSSILFSKGINTNNIIMLNDGDKLATNVDELIITTSNSETLTYEIVSFINDNYTSNLDFILDSINEIKNSLDTILESKNREIEINGGGGTLTGASTIASNGYKSILIRRISGSITINGHLTLNNQVRTFTVGNGDGVVPDVVITGTGTWQWISSK